MQRAFMKACWQATTAENGAIAIWNGCLRAPTRALRLRRRQTEPLIVITRLSDVVLAGAVMPRSHAEFTALTDVRGYRERDVCAGPASLARRIKILGVGAGAVGQLASRHRASVALVRLAT